MSQGASPLQRTPYSPAMLRASFWATSAMTRDVGQRFLNRPPLFFLAWGWLDWRLDAQLLASGKAEPMVAVRSKPVTNHEEQIVESFLTDGPLLPSRIRRTLGTHAMRIGLVRLHTALALLLPMLILGFHAPQANASLIGDDVRRLGVFPNPRPTPE